MAYVIRVDLSLETPHYIQGGNYGIPMRLTTKKADARWTVTRESAEKVRLTLPDTIRGLASVEEV